MLINKITSGTGLEGFYEIQLTVDYDEEKMEILGHRWNVFLYDINKQQISEGIGDKTLVKVLKKVASSVNMMYPNIGREIISLAISSIKKVKLQEELLNSGEFLSLREEIKTIKGYILRNF